MPRGVWNRLLPMPGFILGICLSAIPASVARGQGFAETASGKSATPAVTPAMPSPRPSPEGSVATPSASHSPGSPGNKPEGKPGDTPAASAPKSVTQRPVKPTVPPNREELLVQPDAHGRIKFNFQGHAWPDVLNWLAKISKLNLDWQEMPGDYLNLRTQRSYTLEEARDLINRHLLDRGYTLLRQGEVLSVVNLKKLDPALVPRIAPAALDEHLDHEFVKVLFPLDSLMAEAASEELKPLLSPNGRLSPLKKTNRIEVLDTVANLREVRSVLAAEQSSGSRQRVKEFKLQYVRAADIRPQLQELLGLEKSPDNSSGGQNPNQPGGSRGYSSGGMVMSSSGQPGQPGQPGMMPTKPPLQVHFIVNVRENSIFANAPADQMAIIGEAVRLLDIPSQRNRGQGLAQTLGRPRVYRLSALDPEPVVKMLEELGDLDPSSRLHVDKKNRAIIADASLADHLTIQMLVKKLDGTDRKFEVVKLRKLEADYVAGSIEFMMGGGEKKKKNDSNPYWGFYSWGQRQEPEVETQKFRVDADTSHNRLLLWANDVELEEIRHLLIKLGEIPADGDASRLNILEDLTPGESQQLLERFRKLWPSVGDNPLQIDPRLETEKPRAAPLSAPPVRRSPAPLPEEKRTHRAPSHSGKPHVVAIADVEPLPEAAVPRSSSDSRSAANAATENVPPGLPPRGKAAAPPPVRITRSPEGGLSVSCDDPRVLERVEQLFNDLAPPRRDYKVFKMRYRSTFVEGVALNLKDFFDEKEGKDRSSFDSWYWGWGGSNNQKTDERRLSKRRPLKFIADSDSNSILVTGADPQQLRIIAELIEIYDQPETRDPKAVRQTRIVSLKYSKAKVIAAAVKDVYRDLLSANDPAFAGQGGKDRDKKTSESRYTYIFNSSDEKRPETPIRFKGLLSIGVDELSNTLIVSSEAVLMENILKTISVLDEAARPMVPRLQVVEVNRKVNAIELQKSLKSMLGKLPISPEPMLPKLPRAQSPGEQPPANGG